MTDDRVEWHIWNFARWQWASREQGLGYPSRASGHMENYRSGGDSEKNWDSVCKRLADATDAAINDLKPIYRDAIYAHDIGGAWPHPALALGIHYRAAIPQVGRGLDKRGIV